MRIFRPEISNDRLKFDVALRCRWTCSKRITPSVAVIFTPTDVLLSYSSPPKREVKSREATLRACPNSVETEDAVHDSLEFRHLPDGCSSELGLNMTLVEDFHRDIETNWNIRQVR